MKPTYCPLAEFLQRGGQVRLTGVMSFVFVYPNGFSYDTGGSTLDIEAGLALAEEYWVRRMYDRMFTRHEDV